MNGNRKYEYSLEPAEIREFCRKALVEDLKKRQVFWVLIAILWLLEAYYLQEGSLAVVLPIILSVIVGGFSWILMGFCIFLAAMMILRIYFRDHRSGEGLTESVDNSAYPHYLPLDQQVTVLEDLGLSVDQDQVETLRDNMETYDMLALAEGSCLEGVTEMEENTEKFDWARAFKLATGLEMERCFAPADVSP